MKNDEWRVGDTLYQKDFKKKGKLTDPKKWLKDYPSLWTKIKWKLFGVPVSSGPSSNGESKSL